MPNFFKENNNYYSTTKKDKYGNPVKLKGCAKSGCKIHEHGGVEKIEKVISILDSKVDVLTSIVEKQNEKIEMQSKLIDKLIEMQLRKNYNG